MCQRPRPTLRLGLDRWDIDRADIEIDASFARSGNFGTVNKVRGVKIKNMGMRLRGIATPQFAFISGNLEGPDGGGDQDTEERGRRGRFNRRDRGYEDDAPPKPRSGEH